LKKPLAGEEDIVTTIRPLIQRHPMLAYFALTFALSWGGVLLILGGPGGIPGTPEQLESLLPFAVLAMVAGPSVAGMLLTGLVHGRAGYRELLSRLLRWRVGARWYAVTLLFAPLLFTALSFALSLISPDFLPDVFTSDEKTSLVLAGIAGALVAGVFEELGWTGFAVPTLRRRYGVLGTGILVGFPWAAWHLLVTLWASGGASGDLAQFSYLLDPFLFLVAFRVLMVWAYDRTGSLLVAMLMHASLTASTLILGAGTAGVQLVTFDLAWAALLWLVVAGITLANGGHLSQQPLRGRVA
jgi:membrane protease YdiL (CAAX protease family)